MTLHLIHTKNLFIFEQLAIEEMLLRSDSNDWCWINEGSAPAIVMGISGKPDELLYQEKVLAANIPVIKRFSGGGTVIVDENTLFVTFIFQKKRHSFPPYPEPILRWSEKIYKDAFSLSDFHLRENDYVIGEKKCGGNAQYIRKERWLHHTSFLWDFTSENMELLRNPKRAPSYRAKRSHDDFLCTLKEYFPKKEPLLEKIKETLHTLYPIQHRSLSSIEPLPYRKSTTYISLD